jgi:hypothetical protein
MGRKPTIKRDYSKYEARDAREISKRAVERARATKCLKPHELLYYWANGVFIGGLQPDPDQQIAAAIAAAPYYAPKLANIELKAEHHVKAVIGAVPLTAEQWASKYLPGQSTHLLPQNNNTGSLAIEDKSAITLEGTPPTSEVPISDTANPANQNENPENADAPAANSKTESETV